MTSTRTSEMKCMLCLSENANAIGSHLVTNWVLEPSIGKRYSEAAFTIDPSQLQTSAHYGRDRLDNPTTEITRNPHVADHVFCSQCEKRLAALENQVAPFLKQKIHEPRFAAQFVIQDIGGGARLKESKQFPSKPFHLFAYSLIWRLCLQQRLSSGAACLHPKIEESLRATLAAGLSRPLSDIDKTELALPYPYTILTSEGIVDGSRDFTNIDPIQDNPTSFMFPKFILLLHGGDKLPVTRRGLPIAVQWSDHEWAHYKPEDAPKLVFVPQEAWQEAVKYFGEAAQKQWLETAINTLVKAKRISPEDALARLLDQAKQITGTPGKIDMGSIGPALKQLLQQQF